MVVDQLSLVPRTDDALELQLQIALRLRVWLLTSQRAVEVVHGAEVVTVLARDDSELVVRMAGIWVEFIGELVEAHRWAPFALLRLLCLHRAITRKITEMDQDLVTGDEDLFVESGGYARAPRCLGRLLLPALGDLA